MKKKKIALLVLSAVFCCAGLAACNKKPAGSSDSSDKGDFSGLVYELEVDVSELSLKIGESYQLTAQTEPGLTIEYSSTNEDVAIVDATGKITAKNLGTAEIVVSVGEFTQKRVLLKVEQEFSSLYSIELGVNQINLRSGETFVIDAWVSYEGEKVEGAALQYVSDQPTVATVDASGKIEALTTGSTNVTVSYVADGETKAIGVVSVTVIGEYTIETEFVNEKGYLTIGETANASVLSVKNGNGDEVAYQADEISWSSSDPSVAAVSGGIIKALRSGSVTITVTYKYGAAMTFSVNVAKNRFFMSSVVKSYIRELFLVFIVFSYLTLYKVLTLLSFS